MLLILVIHSLSKLKTWTSQCDDIGDTHSPEPEKLEEPKFPLEALSLESRIMRNQGSIQNSSVKIKRGELKFLELQAQNSESKKYTIQKTDDCREKESSSKESKCVKFNLQVRELEDTTEHHLREGSSSGQSISNDKMDMVQSLEIDELFWMGPPPKNLKSNLQKPQLAVKDKSLSKSTRPKSTVWANPTFDITEQASVRSSTEGKSSRTGMIDAQILRKHRNKIARNIVLAQTPLLLFRIPYVLLENKTKLITANPSHFPGVSEIYSSKNCSSSQFH